MATILALCLFNGIAFLGLYISMRRNGVSKVQNGVLISVFVALGIAQIYVVGFFFNASLDTVVIWNNEPPLFVWFVTILILAASEEIARAWVYFRVFKSLNLGQRVWSGMVIGFFELFIVIIIAIYGFALNWFGFLDKGGLDQAVDWSSSQFSTAMSYFVPLIILKIPSIIMHAGASAIMKRDQNFLVRVGLAIGVHSIFNAAIYYAASAM